MYEKIIEEKLEILIAYSPKKEKVRMFGEKFVENNRNKCKIEYENREFELTEFFDDIKNYYRREEIIKIKLKVKGNITNLSHMFDDCKSLVDFPNKVNEVPHNNYNILDDNNTHNNNLYNGLNNMTDDLEYLTTNLVSFKPYNPFEYKPFSKLVNRKVTDISFMFYNCESLKLLPEEMAGWDTSNITDMSNFVNGCLSIEELPNISKWKTKNVANISFMFSKCEKLKELPDISIWDTSNVKNMKSLFFECKLLSHLPDISKLDTKNVTNLSFLFNGCISLMVLPEISKWNISKVKNISYMFNNCKSLMALPDLSKWNTKEVCDMRYTFYYCESLSKFPDISKWDTSKVKDMNNMFFECKSLVSLPDISNWNTQSVKNMSFMFYNCNSLISFPDISKWKYNKLCLDNQRIVGLFNSINSPN